MSKNKKKFNKKLFLVLLLYIVLGAVLVKNVGSTVYEIYSKSSEKKNYEKQLVELEEKEEELNSTVTKLQDPDYIEKYAREKYLYSKDGEIIIRIPE